MCLDLEERGCSTRSTVQARRGADHSDASSMAGAADLPGMAEAAAEAAAYNAAGTAFLSISTCSAP